MTTQKTLQELQAQEAALLLQMNSLDAQLSQLKAKYEAARIASIDRIASLVARTNAVIADIRFYEEQLGIS